MKTVIIAFNAGPSSGLDGSVFGPFVSFDAAREYGQNKLTDSRWVVTNLTDPAALEFGVEQTHVA